MIYIVLRGCHFASFILSYIDNKTDVLVTFPFAFIMGNNRRIEV